MSSFAQGLGLSSAFFAGCLMAPFVVSSIGAQDSAPTVAPVQPAARWEYQCARPQGSYSEKMAILNAHGANGWELVGITAANAPNNPDITYCFKRRL